MVDANFGRVLGRIFYGKEEYPPSKNKIWRLAKKLIPDKQCKQFNLGIIDLGALICKPHSPKCKQCRRVGEKLFLKGERCFSPKCAMIKRNYPPGAHGQKGSPKLSEYGLQLQEKQKLRHMYGVTERQFRNLFDKAGKMGGVHGENFMFLLESRLDNLVYRLGLARTRRQARQLVSHGHITVDGKQVDIPSYIVEPSQLIGVREKSHNLVIVKESLEATINRPGYLTFDEKKVEGMYTRLPMREELHPEIKETLNLWRTVK